MRERHIVVAVARLVERARRRASADRAAGRAVAARGHLLLAGRQRHVLRRVGLHRGSRSPCCTEKWRGHAIGDPRAAYSSTRALGPDLDARAVTHRSVHDIYAALPSGKLVVNPDEELAYVAQEGAGTSQPLFGAGMDELFNQDGQLFDMNRLIACALGCGHSARCSHAR